MAQREHVTKKVDQRVFTNTATKTKRINLSDRPMRGGIRL